MITIDDFTLLPEGSRNTPDGTVVRCPLCGRNGIVVHPDQAGSYCIHAEESELQCDGMRTDPTDCCSLPSFARALP